MATDWRRVEGRATPFSHPCLPLVSYTEYGWGVCCLLLFKKSIIAVLNREKLTKFSGSPDWLFLSC